MKRNILFMAVTILCYTAAAQEPLSDTGRKNGNGIKYKLLINSTELFFQNINLTAERLFEKQAWGVTLAYKPAIQNGGSISGGATGMFGDYTYQNSFNPVYNAISIGINSQRAVEIKHHRHLHFELELLYRYWWFNNKNVRFDNVEGYNFNGTRSESMHVCNAKALIFFPLVAWKTQKTKFVADFFGGTDVRYKNYNYITNNGMVMHTYYNYLREKSDMWVGSPYIGMQIGIGR